MMQKTLFLLVLILISAAGCASSPKTGSLPPEEKLNNAKPEENKKIESIEELRKKVEKQQREIEALRQEKARSDSERLRLERERERAEAERIRLEQERTEAERLRMERERSETEQVRLERERAQAERLRLERERAEAERIRLERERAEAERLRLEQERAEAERIRLEQERAEAERLRLEQERAARQSELLKIDKEKLSFYRQDQARVTGNVFTLKVPAGKTAYLARNKKPVQFHGYSEIGSRMNPVLSEVKILPLNENLIPLLSKQPGSFVIFFLPEGLKGKVQLEDQFELASLRTSGGNILFIINIIVDKNGVILLDGEQPSVRQGSPPAFFRFDALDLRLVRDS